MFIDIDTSKGYHFKEDGIRKIEENYGAKFMGYWAIKTQNGWSETPVDVFYQPNPDTSKGHTHYFGMYEKDGVAWICDASSAFAEPIIGIMAEDGEVLVSRYRHDYREKDGVMIDGGRDYVRRSLTGMPVIVEIDGDVFNITMENMNV
jgi:hypothetical protein